ncbi:hypothetical protein BDR05DRAFT_988980, partial [Suillus weaverae]
MIVFLIISYGSSSIVVCQAFPHGLKESVGFTGLPSLFFGIALLLQVVITLLGLRAAKILTWSAHPSIRKVIFSLLGVIVVYAGSAALAMYISKLYGFNMSPTWTFMSSFQFNTIWFHLPSIGGPDWGVNVQGWILAFVIVVVVQGPLTLGLHCSELIVNVIRDERQWRSATRREGLRTTTNPLKQVFTDPCCLVLFFAKPLLHWMFGLSFSLDNMAYDELVPMVLIYISITQFSSLNTFAHTRADLELMYSAGYICLFLHFCRIAPTTRPQPAAYGHLQTLANLVDEWSLVM